MGCLLAMIGAASPRFGLFVFWVLRPARVDAAFDTFVLPLIGIIFFPMATLLYAVLHTPGAGLDGWEWFWVGVAALFDVAHSSAVAARREELMPRRYQQQPML